MTNLLQLSYWLDTSVTQQPASASMWLVVAFGVVWVVAVLATRVRGKVSRPVAVAECVAGALAALVALGRIFGVPVLGWRVGWLAAALIALAPLIVRGVRAARTDGFFADAAHALAFARPEQTRTFRPVALAVWFGVVAVGLAGAFAAARLPLVAAMALALLVLGIAFGFEFARTQRAGPSLSLAALALTPLLLSALVLAARVGVAVVARLLSGEYRVVEPFASALDLELAIVIGGGYALALSVCFAASTRATFFKVASVAIVVATIAWASWAALTLRTHGVTGSDPYAYAQMAVDLATRGTVFHSFPLVRVTHDLVIPSAPIVHVGFKIPHDIGRASTTVWPVGFSALLAMGYRVRGETALYLVAPLLALASLLATAWLARLVLHRESAPFAWMASAVAVLLTATSYQQVEWQLVPMADVGAQLFSLLALALALFAVTRARRFRVALIALSGVCLGLAFDIRYTQVLIAPALALAIWMYARDNRTRVAWLAVCAVFACVAVAPVMLYHTHAFGSPLAVGSEEFGNFDLSRAPATFARIIGELLSPREFGLFIPFVVMGGAWLWRAERRMMLVLLAFTLPLFAFHVWYWPLRLRDILSLFPVACVWAAIGVVAIARWLRNRRAASLAFAAYVVLVAAAFFARSSQTLQLPVTRGFGAFGYLVREQRESFDAIRALTPPNAIVASSLNSGAVDLHSGRLAFRPAEWTPDQLVAFTRRVQAEGSPVFVLDDGVELATSIATLREAFGLTEVARVDVPYYLAGSGSENRRAALYRVGR